MCHVGGPTDAVLEKLDEAYKAAALPPHSASWILGEFPREGLYPRFEGRWGVDIGRTFCILPPRNTHAVFRLAEVKARAWMKLPD
jgi:hypothetical protein